MESSIKLPYRFYPIVISIEFDQYLLQNVIFEHLLLFQWSFFSEQPRFVESLSNPVDPITFIDARDNLCTNWGKNSSQITISRKRNICFSCRCTKSDIRWIFYVNGTSEKKHQSEKSFQMKYKSNE